jgi:hypothetical protein
MNSRLLTTPLVSALVLAAFLSFGNVANAQEEQPLQHCTSTVSPDSTQVEDFQCFGTFAEAISMATNGRVSLVESVEPQDVTQGMLDEGVQQGMGDASALQATVIGIEYRDTRFGGSSWTVTGTPAGCSDGTTYGLTSLPAGWDDVISSARVYGGCSVAIHFQNRNYNQGTNGSRVDCTCNTMGIMNDRTSSINWR